MIEKTYNSLLPLNSEKIVESVRSFIQEGKTTLALELGIKESQYLLGDLNYLEKHTESALGDMWSSVKYIKPRNEREVALKKLVESIFYYNADERTRVNKTEKYRQIVSDLRSVKNMLDPGEIYYAILLDYMGLAKRNIGKREDAYRDFTSSENVLRDLLNHEFWYKDAYWWLGFVCFNIARLDEEKRDMISAIENYAKAVGYRKRALELKGNDYVDTTPFRMQYTKAAIHLWKFCEKYDMENEWGDITGLPLERTGHAVIDVLKDVPDHYVLPGLVASVGEIVIKKYGRDELDEEIREEVKVLADRAIRVLEKWRVMPSLNKNDVETLKKLREL